MRIGMIGGITRNDRSYEQQARAKGHRLELHSGNVHGRGAFGEVTEPGWARAGLPQEIG